VEGGRKGGGRILGGLALLGGGLKVGLGLGSAMRGLTSAPREGVTSAGRGDVSRGGGDVIGGGGLRGGATQAREPFTSEKLGGASPGPRPRGAELRPQRSTMRWCTGGAPGAGRGQCSSARGRGQRPAPERHTARPHTEAQRHPQPQPPVTLGGTVGAAARTTTGKISGLIHMMRWR